MSSDVTGRRTATSRTAQARAEVTTTAGSGDVSMVAPAEVLDFIRYCYRRRGFGWPELYDEMCAVAARGSYRGMDYDALGLLGIRFSLGELPRLAALSGRIVAEERLARQVAERRPDPCAADVVEPGPVRPVVEPAHDVTIPVDEAARVRAALIAAAIAG